MKFTIDTDFESSYTQVEIVDENGTLVIDARLDDEIADDVVDELMEAYTQYLADDLSDEL